MSVMPRIESCSLRTLDGEDRAAITRLCEEAFAEPLTDLFASSPPDLRHLRAFVGGQLVGHACWWPRHFQPRGLPELTAAYVKMVAVDPAWQGRGIGSFLIRRLAEETADYELRVLLTVRVSFYERLGWQRWRGPFAIRGEHGRRHSSVGAVMILPTASTPPLDLDLSLIAEPSRGGHW